MHINKRGRESLRNHSDYRLRSRSKSRERSQNLERNCYRCDGHGHIRSQFMQVRELLDVINSFWQVMVKVEANHVRDHLFLLRMRFTKQFN